jgi:hypothetical protein
MKIEKPLFYLSITLLLLTISWIVFMALSMGDYAPLIDNMEDALEFVKNPGILFYINYINVVILTLTNTIFFALLYLFFKKNYPILSISGIIFIPIYSAYNLFAYTSQISIVQNIQLIYSNPDYVEQIPVLLSQLVQAWNKSSIAFINNFAYAILGIPSIAFGIAFLRKSLLNKITGWLLIISGIAGIIGIIGIISNNQILSLGSTIGGIFFLLFLIFSSMTFYKKVYND